MKIKLKANLNVPVEYEMEVDDTLFKQQMEMEDNYENAEKIKDYYLGCLYDSMSDQNGLSKKEIINFLKTNLCNPKFTRVVYYEAYDENSAGFKDDKKDDYFSLYDD